MPDCVDLKAWMAAAWKLLWKVDPLALSVPLRAALLEAALDVALPEPPAAGVELVELDELEEHAARRATATAPPTVAICLLPRSCISGFSLWV
jgi:hypothetical protein